MTKFYLAARFSRIDEMLGVRDVLEALGHKVTSRWINGAHKAAEDDAEAMRRFALEDIIDIANADTVLLFTEEPRSTPNRGGRHVEFGYAMALPNVTTIVIGPYENAFTTLADQRFDNWSRFVMWITRETMVP